WGAAFAWLTTRKKLDFFDWIVPATVGAFVFYGGNGGNQYGPRYYFEAWPLALITVAKAIDPLLLGGLGGARAAWVASAILGHMAFQIGYAFPRAEREHRVVVEREDLYSKVEEAKLHDAVVVVKSDVSQTRVMPPKDLV